ncbi:hypothetical protein SAMD00019534_125020, partial [Acytostelium subglobosum LB1]|uniref:hypothetical protein n=1 Tax=Acytostelium subglobosum LB1 TaxID=1410327 RepID=UPI000645085C
MKRKFYQHNQTQQQPQTPQQQQQQPSLSIKGYYYDNEQNRYFKITKDRPAKQVDTQEQSVEVDNTQLLCSNRYIDRTSLSINNHLFHNEYQWSRPASSYLCMRDWHCQTETLYQVDTSRSLGQCTNIEPLLLSSRAQTGDAKSTSVLYSKTNGDLSAQRIDMDKKGCLSSTTTSNFTTTTVPTHGEITSIKASRASPGLLLVSYLGQGNEHGGVTILNDLSVAKTLRLKNESVWSSEWHPFGAHLSIGGSGSVYLYDLFHDAIHKQHNSKSDVFAQSFGSNGSLLFNGSRDGQIRTYDLRFKSSNIVQSFNQSSSNDNPFSGVDIASIWPDSSHQPSVWPKLWMTRHSGGEGLSVKSSICSIQSLRDDNYLIVSSMNGQLVKWDRRVGRICVHYDQHCNSHTMLKFTVTDDQNLLISGGEDRYVRIWNLHNGSLLRTLGPFKQPVLSITTLQYNKQQLDNNYFCFGSD